ncbi:hypothetical protein AF72_00040 [Xylella taiwanensis]|uniref:Uncharacterized protein n=1 Tax=Xylella taiwanensis TaxID=1444770 RepID=Z9JLY2_9GAMM|nr:hypothetical protein AF72_00040 [Xylella taiwanensis]
MSYERAINEAMNFNRDSFYFWYYAFPMPLAEEGLRAI